MLNKEEAKEEIRKLVERFSQASKNKDYINGQSEENIKTHYIEPFLEALGWTRWDMLKEERVLRGRADYILKIGNEEVLVIEAKKTGVSLTEEEGRQAVSYAYHRKIKFAVLTNFKEVKVYHALSNIKNVDKNLLKFDEHNVFRIGFEQFLDKFDKLSLLSKESFEKSEINKLLSKKDEKIHKSIDEHILNDLLRIREWLSKELKSKKNYLTQEKIDEIVQVLIDRLIFIRSVEDRGLEPLNYLKSLEADVRQQQVKLQLFPYLLEKFREFNDKYDSKLFEPGILEKEGAFSDETLRKVILALYFGVEGNQERYLFDQIPGDLFGSIYEQYLGTVLSGTDKRVKLESKSGKRKKMGIYYTPAYIVDYIVKNTVGEYIKDKTIDEILEVRIVDPACGSGSFLTRAFQEVCNVVEEKLKKGEKAKTLTFQSYKDRLSLNQKATILSSCVYGVDLDEKAVELAQLNLLLKILEDEKPETRKKILPNMKNNIQCGNSLIDDSKVAGDKAFNWHAQFPDVFRNGGFDVVVGNPPYVRNTELTNKDKSYFSMHYKSAYQQYDIYLLFFELGLNVLRKRGVLGFITPNKFMVSDYGLRLRDIILANSSIQSLVDVSHLTIFKDAMTYPVITTLEKVAERGDIKFKNISSAKELESKEGIIVCQERFMQGDNRLIYDAGNEKSEICKKIESNPKIEKLFFCQRGSPKNKIKTIEKKQDNSLNCIISKDVDRYYSKDRIDLFVVSKLQDKILQKEKILLPRTVLRLKSTYDEGNSFIMDRIYYLLSKEKISLKYVVGVINSNLLDFYYKTNFGTTHVAGGYLDLRGVQIKQIPIKLPNKAQETNIVSLVDRMLVLQKKLHEGKPAGNEKERLEQQIKNIDYEIDQEVYKLYGLTPEEIKIVEESLK